MPQHVLKDLTAAQAESCDFCLGVAGKTPGTGPYDFSDVHLRDRRGPDGQDRLLAGQGRARSRQIDYKIQESNVSVAQLAAGELDLVIRVPPAEGPGLANVPGLKQLNVPGVGIFAINFNNTQRRQGAPPGDRLRDQPARDHREGARRPGDAQLHDPAGLQGLRRHQQVRLRPGQGEGAAQRRPGGTSASRSASSSSPTTRTSPLRRRRSSSTSRTSA